MPTVARVEGPSVALDSTPQQYQTAHLDPNYAAPVVRGLDQLSQVAGDIAAHEQLKADTAAVLESQRKLSDFQRTWFDPNNPQGVYASKGRDALGLVDKVAPDFDRVQAELEGNLKSERAREAFKRYAAGQRESMLDRVNGYAVQEHDGYVAAEFKASVANSVDLASTAAMEGRYKDQANEVTNGLESIRAQAVVLGEPEDTTKLKERDYLSSVHTTVVNGLLASGKVGEALSYFDANAEDIAGPARADLLARLRPQMVDATAYAYADGAAAGVTPESAGANQTVESLWPHLIAAESEGNQGAVSKVGAIGVAQIMPATGPTAAALAGVAWDPERFRKDPAYNAQLGKAYLQEQLTNFGSAPLALAAYNAGPARVQTWLKLYGDPRRGQISVADWVAKIPFAETREYVTKIIGASPTGADNLPSNGLLVKGNITNLYDRKVLHNPDGSYSTTSSMSIGTDAGEVLIPTVIDGVRLSNKDAIAHYRQTGEHLGIFDSPAHADAYAKALHESQAARGTGITAAAGGPPAAEAARPASGGSLEAQLADARRFTDPAVRERVEQIIRGQHAAHEQDQQDLERETRKSILSTVESMDPRAPLSKSLPPDQYAFAAQNGLLSSLEQRLRERATGVDPVTPPDLLANLHRIFYDATQGSSPGRQAIALKAVQGMDVYSIGSLSPKDREWAEQNRLAILHPSKANQAADFATEAQILDATRSRLGIPSGQKGDAKFGPFLQEYNDAKRKAVASGKKDLSAEDRQQIVDSLLAPWVRKNFFLGVNVQTSNQPAYQAVHAIPPDIRQQLEAGGRRKLGRDPSPTELLQAWWVYRQTPK